ncbi:hypothetical protein ACFQZ4_05950 [Catellatospora coxensis]|uniref:Uncharacterized protein n=1 Tax=Catellatospora coxensis TaxID=310354 RepID=A0A8J3KXW0_9ACTN|nr:hypothetical protein Cco03nite_20790 [Catellatospora coxensis]
MELRGRDPLGHGREANTTISRKAQLPTHLVPGYDRKSRLPAVTFDDLVQALTEDGVQLELR